MKALVLAPFDKPSLEKLGSRVEVIQRSWTDTGELLEPEQFLQYINHQDVQIIVMEADFIFEEVLDETDKLRLIAVCRGTVNNVALDAAARKGITVINTPGRNSIAVAELTIGLALCLARHIPQAHQTVHSGEWQDPVGPYIGLRGIELSGKTAGIIGFGAIGREVARRLRAFSMNIQAYDPYVNGAIMVEEGVQPVDLDTLLEQADLITLHCTAGEGSRGMIGPAQIGLIKPGAYLVNTASWEVIDEAALFAALEKHRLGGAAFDIFATHPLSRQSPLLKMDNVILTPHIGGATDNTIVRYSAMITADILRFLDGKRPLNLLNPEAWRGNGL
jgi:D-3-phosphoglycerate dehydrogenase / 2-oxoglutarate reductase